LRVLHVLNGAGGGAALSTLGLIESLRSLAGVDAVAVCHDAGSPQERERLRDAVGGRVLFLPLYWWNRKIRAASWKRPLLELRQIARTGWGRGSSLRVAAFARREGADLIHTNTILTPEGGRAARLLRLPHVWHVRELIGTSFPLALGGAELGAAVVSLSSRLVANSEATAAQLRPLVPAGHLTVVPNGIDLARFSARAPSRKTVVVGMVASLASRVKKHGLFIEALSRVQTPVEVRLFGEDSRDGYAAGLRARVKALGLEGRFTFMGHEDPARIMAGLDILVHPADGESFGRVVVEAMAAGLPVVGVRGGGVGEIVVHEETGLLAAVDDAQGIAAAVDRLARDPEERRRMGTAGRRRAEERYSLEACARGVLDVYQRARPLGLWKNP
jgi:glycosyltransferase involved in cell wall biosynthesis